MWNVKCMTIPALTGATKIVTKGLKKNSEDIERKRSADPIKQTAILGKSHMIRKVLQFQI